MRKNRRGQPTAIALGSERKGMQPEFERRCEKAGETPALLLVSKGDSLNIAVASGVILYEVQPAAALRSEVEPQRPPIPPDIRKFPVLWRIG